MISSVRTRVREIRVETFLLSFFLALGVALTAVSPGHGAVLADLDILGAVEEEFLADPGINSNRIIVTVADRVVTLSGEVSSILEKQRAARLAAAVRGVALVVNDLEVDPVGVVTDEELKQRVRDALLINPATEAFEIRVTADEGVVELRGTVESFPEKTLAETVAKSVRGAKDVINLIEIDYPVARADSEIAEDVRQTLRWDALVDAVGIDVSVSGGVVTLSGVVDSLAEKNRAIQDSWITGVIDVKADKLKVSDLDVAVAETLVVVEEYTDQDIQDAVNDALLFDPRVNSAKVSVRVKDGVVTLSGTVDSMQAYNAAEYDARTRLGVERVRNHLKIAPPERPDDKKLAADLHRALINNPYVERYEITANVIDGVAYLSGSVDSFFDKTQAGLAATGIRGIERVVNNIRVENVTDLYRYDPYVDLDFAPEILTYEYRPTMTGKSDAEIFLDIRDQLFWSPFVDANQVTVLVEDGVATLTGTVDSFFESNAAVENAFDGGAIWVKNRLEVK